MTCRDIRKIAIASSLLLGAFILLPSRAEASESEAVKYNNQGFNLARSGKYQEAFQKFNLSIAEDPSIASTYTNRGICYVAYGHPDLALKDYNTAIRLDPTLSFTYHNRAKCNLILKRIPQAVEDLTKALALGDVDPSSTYLGRGTIYAELKKFSLAKSDLDQSIKLNPRNPLAYSIRGRVFLFQNEYQRAVQDFELAIQLDPKLQKDASFPLAIALMNLKQKDKAITAINMAIRLNPTNIDAYLIRAKMRAEGADYELAAADVHEALRQRPDNAILLGRSAEWNYLSGRFESSIRDCDQAIKLNPADRKLYPLRLKVNCLLSRWEAAAKNADDLMGTADWSHKDVPEMAMLSFLAYQRTNQPEKAAKLLDEGLKQATGDSWTHVLFEFLHGDITADRLIELAVTEGQTRDALSWIALNSSLDRKVRESSLQQLRDSKPQDTNRLPYQLAISEIAQLKNTSTGTGTGTSTSTERSAHAIEGQ